MSAANDSFLKTITVAFSLCLVCSLLVAGAAITLKPQQQLNKAADVRLSILQASGIYNPDEKQDIDAVYQEKVQERVIDLETGEFVNDIDVTKFDQRKEAKNPKNNVVLTKEDDKAKIKKRAKQAKVYLVSEAEQLKTIVLPVHGYGLFSTLYGFIALEADTKTVVGIKFYEHGETPGLGGEIENPKWIAKWTGKQIFDQTYQPVLKLVKTGAQSANEIDALSGATMTSRGVENLVAYWLSEQAFGPFLSKLRKEGS